MAFQNIQQETTTTTQPQQQAAPQQQQQTSQQNGQGQNQQGASLVIQGKRSLLFIYRIVVTIQAGHIDAVNHTLVYNNV